MNVLGLFEIDDDAFNDAVNAVKTTVIPTVQDIKGNFDDLLDVFSGQQKASETVVPAITQPTTDPNTVTGRLLGYYNNALSKVGLQGYGGVIAVGLAGFLIFAVVKGKK